MRGIRYVMIGAGLFGLVVASSVAQNPVAAEDRVSMTPGARAGTIGTGIGSAESFAPASPSDADIGEQILLQPATSYEAFSAWTNWNYYWTSNADLLDSTSGSDGFLSGLVGASFVPHLGNNLFGEFVAEQGIYRYARSTDLDFNSLSLTAGAIYVLRDFYDVTLFGNWNYDLLTNAELNDEIFHSHSLNVGLRKVFNISRAHLFFTSFTAEFILDGEPDFALRNDYAWLVGYQANLTRALRLDLYYQLSTQAYVDVSRTDLNQLIGGGLSYAVTDWLSIQTAATLGINNSTEEFYNYFAANLGGGIGILVNF